MSNETRTHGRFSKFLENKNPPSSLFSLVGNFAVQDLCLGHGTDNLLVTVHSTANEVSLANNCRLGTGRSRAAVYYRVRLFTALIFTFRDCG